MRLSIALLVTLVTALLCATAQAQTDTEETTSEVADAAPSEEATASDQPPEGTSDEATDLQPESAPEPPASELPAPEAEPSAPALDGSTYTVRMRDLAQRIDELKEQIRRSHTRLSLLSDTILSGGVGGARAEITFVNDLSSAFRLTKALFVLDGAVQYNKEDDSGALASQKTIPIFSGSIPPGDHTLQVLLKLQGHGYGVFSYLRGYKFEVKSSNSFTVAEGKTIELGVIAWEKGGVTTPLEDRPAIRYKEVLKTTSGGAGGPRGKAAGASKSRASRSISVGTSGGR